MRKAIMKWLLGTDWEEYWELHTKYRDELGKHLDTMKENQKLRQEFIQKCERIIELLDEKEELIKENIRLLRLCNENGIDFRREE